MIENSNDIPSAYSGLFRGAAKLGLLLGSMDIEWTRAVPYLEEFSEELAGFQELGVRNDQPWLELGTKGEGKAFAHRATRLMELQGIEEDDLRRFLVRARHFDHPLIFFSLILSPNEERFFRYILRCRQDIDIVVAMLLDSGIDAESLASLRDMARLLHKDQVHAYTSLQGEKGAGEQRVVFSQPTDVGSWRRVGDLADYLGTDEGFWKTFKTQMEAQSAPSFVTLSFGSTHGNPGLGLVFQDVSIESLEKVCSSFFHDQNSFEQADLLLRICARKRASRVALFLGDKGLEKMELFAS